MGNIYSEIIVFIIPWDVSPLKSTSPSSKESTFNLFDKKNMVPNKRRLSITIKMSSVMEIRFLLREHF